MESFKGDSCSNEVPGNMSSAKSTSIIVSLEHALPKNIQMLLNPLLSFLQAPYQELI